ncbi:MAG: hypothetical protein PHX04_02665 [Bacilli bacterium]|nr:hypothetical protein [Bacilli bacterium]
MAHTLIMPKQTGKKDALYASLELYYNSSKRGEEWYNNNNFKKEIQKSLLYLSKGAQNGPYLVKQSELARYFGLVKYDYGTRPGKAHITNRGIRFFNAYLSNDIDMQLSIIMDSILSDSFGRNNCAIESSDSDVDAPKLFLKAIVDLNGISRKGLAYLLYVIHDLKIGYSDAIIELTKTNNQEREIPIEVANKYSDVKFTVLLTELGITTEQNNKYQLTEFTKKEYYNNIKNISIYNKEPELILTLREDIQVDEDERFNDNTIINELSQNRIVSSFTYDINSERFKKQNNRNPVSYKVGNILKYKTNARISKTAISLAEYKCSIDHSHTTFNSKLGTQYMEAHHLIPMCAQKDFSINIDRIENIISICPICHCGIHLGNQEFKLDLLKKLYDLKEQELKSVGININFGELFSKYYR